MGAARPQRLEAVTCNTAKHCFRTNVAARRAARQQMGKQRNVILRVYRCEECHYWHMTSTPQMKEFQTIRYLRMRREVEWEP